MKQTIVLALVFGCIASSIASAREGSHSGKIIVRNVVGAASFATGGNTLIASKIGDEVPSGCAIETSKGSFVELSFGVNGSIVRLTETTRVAIRKVELLGAGRKAAVEMKLDLLAGRILGSVVLLARGSSFEIGTPTGFARTHGGNFEITSGKDFKGVFKSHYAVWKGDLAVTEKVDGVEKSWNVERERPRNWTFGDPAPPGTDWLASLQPRMPPSSWQVPHPIVYPQPFPQLGVVGAKH